MDSTSKDHKMEDIEEPFIMDMDFDTAHKDCKDFHMGQFELDKPLLDS
jgi:hypothetical protein